MLTDRIAQALALAVKAHDGQNRKATSIPYIAHPMGTASIALEYGADEEQVIAALLHDAVEDGGPSYAIRIRELFGDRVATIVDGCTDGVPDENGQKSDWEVRKRTYLAHLESASSDVLLVSGSDKLHNVRAIVEDLHSIGLQVYDRFSASKHQTLWYYDSLAKIYESRGTPISKALRKAVDSMLRLSISKVDQQTIQSYMETNYQVEGPTHFILTVGHESDELLDLYKKLSVKSCAFITAFNPWSIPLSDEENIIREQRLVDFLRTKGYHSVPGIGTHPSNSWPGERSQMVWGISKSQAREIAAEFHQNAFVWAGQDRIPELILLR